MSGEISKPDLFSKFIQVHGSDWVDATGFFREVGDVRLAVLSGFDGIPVFVTDAELNITYPTYLRVYFNPKLRFEWVRRRVVERQVINMLNNYTKIEFLYKDPLQNE